MHEHIDPISGRLWGGVDGRFEIVCKVFYGEMHGREMSLRCRTGTWITDLGLFGPAWLCVCGCVCVHRRSVYFTSLCFCVLYQYEHVPMGDKFSH